MQIIDQKIIQVNSKSANRQTKKNYAIIFLSIVIEKYTSYRPKSRSHRKKKLQVIDQKMQVND